MREPPVEAVTAAAGALDGETLRSAAGALAGGIVRSAAGAIVGTASESGVVKTPDGSEEASVTLKFGDEEAGAVADDGAESPCVAAVIIRSGAFVGALDGALVGVPEDVPDGVFKTTGADIIESTA